MKFKNKEFPDYFFYTCIILLFVLDVFSFSFFEKQLLNFILCFYFLTLYYEKNVMRLIALILLVSLQSSFHYGQFGVQLMCLIPVTFVGIYAQRFLYAIPMQTYMLLVVFLVAQSLWIEPYFLKSSSISSYTNLKIFANIIVMWFLSLIFYTQGKLGDRWRANFSFLEESPDS